MKFYVLWTYVANYSNLLEVEADSPENAMDKLGFEYYSDDFHKKVQIYVFDKPPVFKIIKSE